MAKPRHRERKYSAVISAVTFQNRRLDGQGVISYPGSGELCLGL